MSRDIEFENKNLQPQIDLPRGVRAHTVYCSTEKRWLVYSVGKTRKEAKAKAEGTLGMSLNPVNMFLHGFTTRTLDIGEPYDVWGDGKGSFNHGEDDGFNHAR